MTTCRRPLQRLVETCIIRHSSRSTQRCLPAYRLCLCGSTPAPRSLHVGTVSFRHDPRNTLEEALGRVARLGAEYAAEEEEEELALLLLVTPGLARAAKDANLPTDLALAALGRVPKTLESVTAVVDAVCLEREAHEPSEGFAYTLCSRQDTPLLLSSTQVRSTANKPGWVTFRFDTHKGEQKSRWDVQLPLAQTVFTTGLTSTLIYRMHNSAAPTDTTSQLVAERFLESVVFNVPPSVTSTSELKIEHFPLVPLTTCQAVNSSMGNIVRIVVPLQTTHQSNREEPASKRLEEAVTDYFTACDAAPAPVNVWALIIPQRIISEKHSADLDAVLHSSQDQLRAMWSSRQDQDRAMKQYSRLLVKLLRKGGRLVKVLSGGGGWGKKAGLLSLDPDLEYSTRELRDDFGWSFDFDDASSIAQESDLDQALGKSVEDGDALIFLIEPRTGAGMVAQRTNGSDAVFRLGACRANEANGDTAEAPQAQQPDDASISALTTFQAFSETGLAVKVVTNGHPVGRSKLDVPGLTITAR